MELINNVILTASTGNVTLDEDIVYIRKQVAVGRKASHEVALRLLKIRNEELYKVKFDTFSDFCSDYFGINKATGSKLVKVAERFLVEGDTYSEYTISQLMEMRNATSEQLGLIKPTMTVKAIRDVLNPKTVIEDKSCDVATDKTDKTDKNDKTDKTDNTDKTEVKYELVLGNKKTPDKVVGEGWTLYMDMSHTPDHVEITSLGGLCNFSDYLRSKYLPEVLNAQEIKTVIMFDKTK